MLRNSILFLLVAFCQNLSASVLLSACKFSTSLDRSRQEIVGNKNVAALNWKNFSNWTSVPFGKVLTEEQRLWLHHYLNTTHQGRLTSFIPSLKDMNDELPDEIYNGLMVFFETSLSILQKHLGEREIIPRLHIHTELYEGPKKGHRHSRDTVTIAFPEMGPHTWITKDHIPIPQDHLGIFFSQFHGTPESPGPRLWLGIATYSNNPDYYNPKHKKRYYDSYNRAIPFE